VTGTNSIDSSSGQLGTVVSGNATGVYGSTSNGYGVYGSGSTGLYGGGSSYGVQGFSNSVGVYGYDSANNAYGQLGTVVSGNPTGVYGNANVSLGIGVSGTGTVTGVSGIGGDWGVYGSSTNGYGVYGNANSLSGVGVYGINSANSSYGQLGTNVNGSATGVYGNGSVNGIYGVSSSGTAVYGSTASGNGVLGSSTNATGALATAVNSNATGAYGTSASSTGYGVYGNTTGTYATGVYGIGFSGVEGVANSTSDAFGVWGIAGTGSPTYAGNFSGDVDVAGTLTKTTGAFKIDHPLDPANKYLVHSFVESPDMKNVYDGITVLDANGEAWVDLPEWFESLNSDFRYQLTAIGAPAPGLYIAEEISGNRFKIAGGKPGGKVSWQVTGIRQDAYAKAHRIQVEEEKPEAEKGFYRHPELFGQPKEKGIEWARHPEQMRQLESGAKPSTPLSGGVR
jgi:hypothetical protein